MMRTLIIMSFVVGLCMLSFLELAKTSKQIYQDAGMKNKNLKLQQGFKKTTDFEKS